MLSSDEKIDILFQQTDRANPLTQQLFSIAQSHLFLESMEEISSLPEPEGAGKPQKQAKKSSPQADAAKIVLKDFKLPSLPHIVFELQQVVEEPNSSAEDLAKVIMKDPKLTSALLKLVNSAMFGMASQVDTISRAIAIAGTKQMNALAIGTLMLNLYKDPLSQLPDLESFWKHSLACGVTAKHLATISKQDDPERFFIAGLLHDLGKLILAVTYPEDFAKAKALVAKQGMLHHQAEKTIFGFDHALLGAMILRHWNFPASLVSTVIYHHNPSSSLKSKDPHIIHVADCLAKCLGYFSYMPDYIPQLDNEAWDTLHIPIPDLPDLADTISAECHEMFSAILYG